MKALDIRFNFLGLVKSIYPCLKLEFDPRNKPGRIVSNINHTIEAWR